MADKKISALDAAAAVTGDDLFEMVDDPAGTPTSKKATGTQIQTLANAGTWAGTTIALDKGGTGQTTQTAAYDALSPNTTRGDLTVRGASNNVLLHVGAANSVLSSNGTDPAWTAPTDITTLAGYSRGIMSDPGRSHTSSAAELTFLTNTAPTITGGTTAVGDFYRGALGGALFHSEGSSRTFIIKIKLGSVAVFTITTAGIATSTQTAWTIDYWWRFTSIGASAAMGGYYTFRLTNSSATTTLQELTGASTASTVDTTGDLTFDITNTNSVSSSSFTNVGGPLICVRTNAP